MSEPNEELQQQVAVGAKPEPPPEEGYWSERRLKVWSAVAMIAAAVVTAATLIFGVVQYQYLREDRRVDKTLGYMERFSSDTLIGEAHRAVSTALWEYASQPNLAVIEADARYDMVLDFIDGYGLSSHVNEIVDFFEELDICLTAHLCDQEKAMLFFGDYALRFQGNFSPHFSERRKLSPNYGGGLMRIAETYRQNVLPQE